MTCSALAAICIGVPTRGRAQARLAPATAATEFVFNRLSQAVELPDGSLLVTDRGDDKLLQVSFDGRAPRELLQHGRGPGEYQHVGPLFAIGGDSVLFVDGFTGRWLVLRGTQAVATISESRPTNTLMGSAVVGVARNGRVLGVHGRTWSGRGVRTLNTADTINLLLGDLRTGTIDTIGTLAGPGMSGFKTEPPANGRPGSMIAINPLATADQAVLFGDGTVVVARRGPYRVDVRAPAGAWQPGATLEPVGRAPTRADQCAAFAELFARRPCAPERLPGWPTALPPFLLSKTLMPVSTVLADASERLVIARTVGGGATDRRYDVINRARQRVAVLTLALNQRVLGFGRGVVYVVETDDDDAQRITRHPWP